MVRPRLHPAAGPHPAAVRDARRHRLRRRRQGPAVRHRQDRGRPVQARGRTGLEHAAVGQRAAPPGSEHTARSARPTAPWWRRQLGRAPRAIRAVAHRCPCGNPDVVETSPRLPDGTPFPTLYYLTCPRAAAAIGTLEASGLMREMTERLRTDAELAAAYRAAHERYLGAREAIGHVGRDRGHQRRRDAEPGEVPARAGRRTRWPRARASTRSATRRWRCCPTGGPAGPCVRRAPP